MGSVVFDLLRFRQHDVLLHAVVAEDEVHADPLEEVRPPAEDRGGFVEEALDLSLLGRGRGVDGDDEVRDAALLAEFVLLDERHVAVNLHAVIVIAVVEAVRVDVRDLAEHGQLLEKVAEVGLLAVLRGEHPGEAAGLVRRLGTEGRELRLQALRRVLPLLIEHRFVHLGQCSCPVLRWCGGVWLGDRRAVGSSGIRSVRRGRRMIWIFRICGVGAIYVRVACIGIRRGRGVVQKILRDLRLAAARRILHPLPELMVTFVELEGQLLQRVEVRLVQVKIVVDTLGAQHAALRPQALVPLLAEGIGRAVDDVVVHRVEDRLDLDVRGEVPERLILVLVRAEHVPEDAVQKDVEVEAVQLLRALEEEREDEVRIIVDRSRVGAHGLRREVHRVAEAVERSRHEAEVDVELGPRFVQYSVSEIDQVLMGPHAFQFRHDGSFLY